MKSILGIVPVIAAMAAGLFPSSVSAENFRATQPKAMKQRPLQLPQLAKFELKNGLRVFLLEDHSLPTISLELAFNSGSVLDPKDQVGRANVCMEFLTSGTKNLDSIAFNEKLADMASKIAGQATDDSQSISLNTLTKNFDGTFNLLKEVLVNPNNSKFEFDKIIKSKIADLKQKRGSAPEVAYRIANTLIYGENHPLGRVETESGYEAMTVSTCTKYLSQTIKPKGADLFIVGDMTKAKVRSYFDHIKGWNGKALALKTPPKPDPREGKIFFVNLKGASQSYVALKNFGPKRNTRDYYDNLILSKVFGEGFSSRINMNLREDKGYTYGARGGFFYGTLGNHFSVGSTVRSDTTYSAVQELYNELANLEMGKEPVTSSELIREKNGSKFGLAGNFATARNSLSMYKNLARFNLPMNYYETFSTKIDKVTAKGVQRAAAKNLKAQTTKILVVGDGETPITQRIDNKDVPLKIDEKQVTLLEGLKYLLKENKIPGSKLVVLDADAKELGSYKL